MTTDKGNCHVFTCSMFNKSSVRTQIKWEKNAFPLVFRFHPSLFFWWGSGDNNTLVCKNAVENVNMLAKLGERMDFQTWTCVLFGIACFSSVTAWALNDILWIQKSIQFFSIISILCFWASYTLFWCSNIWLFNTNLNLIP